jgi:uncharacterized protein (TIGR03437 family)
VRVTLGGQAAYIAYISPTQINALAPNIETGNIAVAVSNSVGTSSAVSAISQNGSASILHVGTYAVATHVDFTPAAKNGTLSGVVTV